MLFWIYVAITATIAALLLRELWRETRWHHQLAYVIILLPLLLRVLQIK